MSQKVLTRFATPTASCYTPSRRLRCRHTLLNLSGSTMQCRSCTRDNREDARYCDRCGQPLTASTPDSAMPIGTPVYVTGRCGFEGVPVHKKTRVILQDRHWAVRPFWYTLIFCDRTGTAIACNGRADITIAFGVRWKQADVPAVVALEHYDGVKGLNLKNVAIRAEDFVSESREIRRIFRTDVEFDRNKWYGYPVEIRGHIAYQNDGAKDWLGGEFGGSGNPWYL